MSELSMQASFNLKSGKLTILHEGPEDVLVIYCRSNPEFDPQVKSQAQWGLLVFPVPWRSKEADPWGSVASHPDLGGPNERPCLKKARWMSWVW